jgi:hypothetical protein
MPYHSLIAQTHDGFERSSSQEASSDSSSASSPPTDDADTPVDGLHGEAGHKQCGHRAGRTGNHHRAANRSAHPPPPRGHPSRSRRAGTSGSSRRRRGHTHTGPNPCGVSRWPQAYDAHSIERRFRHVGTAPHATDRRLGALFSAVSSAFCTRRGEHSAPDDLRARCQKRWFSSVVRR